MFGRDINMQFMSPSVGRRNKFDDESQLILNSPTSSDGDGNSIINGNTEVGFVFPSVNLKKTSVHQVSTIRQPILHPSILPSSHYYCIAES